MGDHGVLSTLVSGGGALVPVQRVTVSSVVACFLVARDAGVTVCTQPSWFAHKCQSNPGDTVNNKLLPSSPSALVAGLFSSQNAGLYVGQSSSEGSGSLVSPDVTAEPEYPLSLEAAVSHTVKLF